MNAHPQSKLLLVTVLLVLAASLAGCSEKVVKIGVLLPETGHAEPYGSSLRQGVELAYEEVVADPAYPLTIEAKFFDTRSDPDRAQQLLEEVYRDGALVAIGGATSDEALAMVPVADRFDRILLSPSASTPELTGISSNFFRIFPSDLLEATRMANFASQTLKLNEVVIVAEKQAYGRSLETVFKQEFERYGGTVPEVVEYPPEAADFSGLVDFVVGIDAEAVYLAGYEEGIASMIQGLRKKGYRGKILTTHAFATPNALVRTGSAAEGVLMTQSVFDVDSDYAHIKSFVTAFEERYGSKPDLFAAHGYDAMKLLAKALVDRPLIPNEVRKGLRAISDFPGVTGSIQFDEQGDVKKFPRVYIVSDDLAVYNYDSYVDAQKRELMARLEELRKKAKQIN